MRKPDVEKSPPKIKTATGAVNHTYKSTKSTQNKSIINLKSINGDEDTSKVNSHRKMDGINKGFFHDAQSNSHF